MQFDVATTRTSRGPGTEIPPSASYLLVKKPIKLSSNSPFKLQKAPTSFLNYRAIGVHEPAEIGELMEL